MAMMQTLPQGYHHPRTLEEVRTLWIGDLQYWVDENYLTSCFSLTGEVVGESQKREEYLCFPGDYCGCYSFFYDVVSGGEQQCQLAARLASSLGTYSKIEVSDEQFLMKLNNETVSVELKNGTVVHGTITASRPLEMQRFPNARERMMREAEEVLKANMEKLMEKGYDESMRLSPGGPDPRHH